MMVEVNPSPPTDLARDILIYFDYIRMHWDETTQDLLLVAFNKCVSRLIPHIGVIEGTR